MMTDVFHHGELAVQAKAGVSVQAQKVGRIITPNLPDGADPFLAQLPILFQGGLDTQSNVWASALTGPNQFIRATDPHTVTIHEHDNHDDPLSDQPDNAHAGFLAIDLATRQRFRFNGQATRNGNTLLVHVEQAYGNCPKYIQLRNLTERAANSHTPAPTRGTRLSENDVHLIKHADTFFIASVAPGHGADVSHRGGPPGFVRTSPDGALTFKDYPGNNMFQTLGNLTTDPRAGLLFIDFATGSTLQLTGRAQVRWPDADPQDPADTGRAVNFQPEHIIRRPNALPLRWELRGFSPFNPQEKSD